MTRPTVHGGEQLPIGRRVARWRVRRRLTQQMLADRLGKSKSWVDKVERGVRALDRYSVVRDIATVLHIDPTELLDPHEPAPTPPVTSLDGVDTIRTALARYHHQPTHLPVDQLRRHTGHAWLAYHHAQYPQLLRTLPTLLDTTHHTPALRASAYQITALVLVKLGAADLSWLAADRAATTDPTSNATIAVAQALRALGRDRLALTATLDATDTTTDHRVRGTLLLQAGLGR
ncbi:helix-turn-helix domain-containing protein [Micromonospora yangpuensis]|uniref:Helix-turn-helix domain-containing protein n=1 Tax=Micromonospora yangpuensis TaxID=683228 RepID=A0A1C6UQ03_9ACTN|nr:helix-turn-helix transcriptional regulator [Micromonospora yangpuensis]GGM08433.1 hypothetical protein GCM10012279_28190 [Micromonospora yangpuensis]SCL55899.1 Helix-turn-helix domain-containing protein [Micromonospora yangpuensis]